MVFSSYAFIFTFFPITYVGYWLLSALYRPIFAKMWLIAASLYFFSQGSSWFVPLFLLTIAFNFIISRLLHRYQQRKMGKLILTIGLIENIGLLVYYKYMYFIVGSLNGLFHFDITPFDIILPLGISFFTFQMIGYLVDCYKGEASRGGLIDYLLFVTFFPKLIIGPLVRYQEIIPQFSSPQAQRFNFEHVKRGLFLFSMGCAKKVLIADPLALFAQSSFVDAGSASPVIVWTGMLANFFYFYFDFSGYVDMAIGLAYFFNIKLPEGFDAPYRARNIQQYWRRWNMTLSKFLGRYVFNYVYKPGKGVTSLCIATLVTFLVSGIWHGAGFNFILWGLFQGIGVCIIALLKVYYPKKHFLPTPLAWLCTFIFLLFSRLVYTSVDSEAFFQMVKGLTNIQYYAGMGMADLLYDIKDFAYANSLELLVLFLAVYIVFATRTSKQHAEKALTSRWHALYATILLVFSLFNMGEVSGFVYFGF